MRLTALACSLLLACAASASAAPRAPRVLTVPGTTEGLVVDSGAAFVLRRTQHSTVIRVDLATGRRTVVFRTDGIPGDPAAAGGVLGFTVDLPGEGGADGVTQLVAVPTATPNGGAVVLRQAPHPVDEECAPFDLDGVTPAGELLLSTFTGRCGSADAVFTMTALGPAGERVLSRGSAIVFAATGPWQLVATAALHSLRLVNTATGATRTYVSTLAGARVEAGDLQPDGRFVLTETLSRRRGGYVERVRVVSPGDGARGGHVLGTVGTPPRLDARFCGGRLVVSRTKDHRTRVTVGGREIARVSTAADPAEGCDAKHLVVEASNATTSPTRLAVVPLR
jgi:hypothetical protein